MKWSVGIEAVGDRIMTTEEIVRLADAVARYDGIASGIGKTSYGVTLLIEAGTREEAVQSATGHLRAAVSSIGLPAWPVVLVEAVSEEEATEHE